MKPGFDGNFTGNGVRVKSERTVTEGGVSRVVEFRADPLDRLYPRVITLLQYNAAQRFRETWERAQISSPGAMDLASPAIPGNASSAPSDVACDALDELRRIKRAFGVDRASYGICVAIAASGDAATHFAVRFSDSRMQRALGKLADVMGV